MHYDALDYEPGEAGASVLLRWLGGRSITCDADEPIALLEKLQIGVVLVDERGRVLSINAPVHGIVTSQGTLALPRLERDRSIEPLLTRISAAEARALGDSRAVAAAFVRDVEDRGVPAVEVLQRLYEFTDAEAHCRRARGWRIARRDLPEAPHRARHGAQPAEADLLQDRHASAGTAGVAVASRCTAQAGARVPMRRSALAPFWVSQPIERPKAPALTCLGHGAAESRPRWTRGFLLDPLTRRGGQSRAGQTSKRPDRTKRRPGGFWRASMVEINPHRIESNRARWRALLSSLLALGFIAIAAPVGANCNVIPGTIQSFRGALGAADRPYAMPGDFVELTVRPEVCDQASVGLADFSGGGGITAADVIVTLLFEPPNGSARDAVIVATDCAAIASKVTACDAVGGVGHAQCYQAGSSDLIVSPGVLESKLRFRFPDTDGRVGTPTDDRTLAGPVTIAITPVNLPLPCGALAAGRCADTGGVVACVDELYAIDGTCRTGTAQLDASFAHFVALPPPNDYEAVCDSAGTPCDGTATEVRFTTDAAGNVYLPFDYLGVRVVLDGVSIPRILRGTPTELDAFAGGAFEPIRIPGNSFLGAFSPEGHRLPPIFTPLRDPNPSGSEPSTLFGSMDAEVGVTRISRRSETLLECAGGDDTGRPCNDAADCPGGTCGAATCRGGSNGGNACTSDAECPGGECGPALFEFRDRYESGIGPVLIADTQYDVEAESPIPIAGLEQTLAMFAFVRSEPLDNEDLNGDTDQADPVLTLRDRETGEVLPIGDGGSPGRAISEAHTGPFRFPIVETLGPLVAFLESETAQGGVDANLNGELFDSTLRLFQVGSGSVADRTPAALPTAGAGLHVNGRSARFLDANRLLFLTPEAREADQITERVGTAFSLNDYGGWEPSISAGGRYVAFSSTDPDLVPGDTNGAADVFVVDRQTGQVTRESFATGCGTTQASGGSQHPSITRDGRYIAYQRPNFLDHPAIYRRDRWTGCTTQIVADGANPSIAADGPSVSFDSDDPNLVPGDTNEEPDVFVSSDACGLARVSVTGAGTQSISGGTFNAISGNGRVAAFVSDTPLVAGDENSVLDVYVHDCWEGTTELASASSLGDAGNGSSDYADPALSADGRFIAFSSAASNLVPGDTNGVKDVFVHDRATRRTTRVSVSSTGEQGNGDSTRGFCCFLFPLQPPNPGPAISPDGRFVAFSSDATNLVPGSSGGGIFVHDRLTGTTRRVDVDPSGSPTNGGSGASISEDGVVAFVSSASNLVPGDTNGLVDVFVRVPDPADAGIDRTGDGIADDEVLRVVDASGVGPATVADLCPAEQIATAGTLVAFLRPESAGATTNPGCTGGSLTGPDVNGDLDENDRVVHSWDGTTVSNLRCAAEAVALSSTRIAALVSEAAQFGTDLNGDFDTDDAVLHVRSATAPAGATCDWIDTDLAGTAIGVSGDRVVVLVSEADQGGVALNGDGDIDDTVLRLVDGTNGTTVPFVDAQGDPLLPPAAEDFVVGSNFAAFRVLESAQSNAAPPACSLNGDADCNDAVMHVVNLATGVIVSTGQAAIPCPVEACDPRQPYRVTESTVRFITAEAQQGDRNGDGVVDGLVVQNFNAAGVEVFGAAAAEAGYCNTTGSACGTDADCGVGGSCFLPPGECILDLETACNPQLADPCGSDAFCEPTGETTGTCHEVQGSCKTNGDCIGAAICEEAAQTENELPEPLAVEAGDAGEQVFASSGICFENRATVCVTNDDCATSEECRAGTCHRNHGACAADADCPAGTCTRDQLTTATAADADADEVADPFDNCPIATNTDQADADSDGTGDACDAWICGNGVREGTPGDAGIEECDDGDQDPGDGCDEVCQLEAVDCADGFDNDGDGKTDYGTGPSNDPGCKTTAGPRENPQCDDGLDNDFDGQVDHPTDPQCRGRWDNDERTNPPCGLGVELALLLVLLRRRIRGTELA